MLLYSCSLRSPLPETHNVAVYQKHRIIEWRSGDTEAMQTTIGVQFDQGSRKEVLQYKPGIFLPLSTIRFQTSSDLPMRVWFESSKTNDDKKASQKQIVFHELVTGGRASGSNTSG